MSENIEKVIVAEGLCFANDDGTIIDGVSFDVQKKGIHGILSPDGEERTALLDVISCSVRGSQGCLTVLGKDVTGLGDQELCQIKKKIGYVRGTEGFYPEMTVFETMTLVGEVRGVESGRLYRQIKEALELTGLEELSKRLIRNLSSKERKLLSFACCVLGNPDIILVDGLLPTELELKGDASELYGLIELLGKMKTVVLATSSYSTVKDLCADVVILSDGRVIAKGDICELEDRSASKGESLETLYSSLVKASQKKERSELFKEKGGRNK